MKKKFIAFIHNVLRYVKLLTEQVRKGNLSKDAVNRKKETGFENGRLLAANSNSDHCPYLEIVNAVQQAHLQKTLLKLRQSWLIDYP